jgi:hypothetical protein
MDESFRAQIETYLSHLDGLIRRGHRLHGMLATDSSDSAAMAATRAWQEDCGVTINQLSGGSKAHWLARSFSDAFLMRAADGGAIAGAAPAEIVQRLIQVLEHAVASLSGMGDGSGVPSLASTPSEMPPRRFEFVHDVDLRPIVEQAYADSRRAFEHGDFDLALRTSCGILEAIVTDALEQKGLVALGASGAPAGKIADWPFETRLAVAERAGIIRGGCARLPAVARAYRDHNDGNGESGAKGRATERDARVTGQVLNVVMRDLNPGR